MNTQREYCRDEFLRGAVRVGLATGLAALTLFLGTRRKVEACAPALCGGCPQRKGCAKRTEAAR